MAGVLIKNLYKRYDNGFEAVTDVNLDIKDREFVVLVGPSGCGKSTTLRMIAGLEEISEGELYIGDRLVNDVAPKDRDIAMVFQNYALYPHMSVYDNMAFGLKLRKFKKADIKKRVHEAAKILDIEHLLDRKPKALSGGQRQRVALGRAIVREPMVFLMDEPLSNLDAKLRVQMRAEITKLHRRLDATTIYVTHDQTEAMTMGDRIVVMKDGVIQQNGAPDDIYNNPVNMFVASFIGSPSINLIKGKVVSVNGGLHFQTNNFDIAIPKDKAEALNKKGYENKNVVLGLRPQNINSEGDEQMAFTATIQVVENMGAEKYLYLDGVGDSDIVGRVDASVNTVPQSQIKLYVDPSKLLFFDAETENIID